jgi:hypothetical protein
MPTCKRHIGFAPAAQTNPSGKRQIAVSVSTPTDHLDNKTDFLRILTNSKF